MNILSSTLLTDLTSHPFEDHYHTLPVVCKCKEPSRSMNTSELISISEDKEHLACDAVGNLSVPIPSEWFQ